MTVKLLVACHKKCDVPSDEIYLPVHVGASGRDSIGFQRDDEGENISALNPEYCELTGLYWAWKNLDADYLGLVHYRRYFTLKNRAYQKSHKALDCVLTGEECRTLLGKYRILVPKKRHYYIETLYSHYSHTFSENQLTETRKIIGELYPDDLEVYDKTLQQRSAYIFNMFVMPKELVADYCTWLFPILSELDRRINTADMTAFEKRYIGRVSERLFNVWLNRKLQDGTLLKNDICDVPYLYIGQIAWGRKVSSFLMAKFFRKKYGKSF